MTRQAGFEQRLRKSPHDPMDLDENGGAALLVLVKLCQSSQLEVHEMIHLDSCVSICSIET